jgi:hypothetical protein
MTNLVVAFVFILLFSAGYSMFAARKRGYDSDLFALGGFLAGPLAIMAVLSAADYAIEEEEQISDMPPVGNELRPGYNAAAPAVVQPAKPAMEAPLDAPPLPVQEAPVAVQQPQVSAPQAAPLAAPPLPVQEAPVAVQQPQVSAPQAAPLAAPPLPVQEAPIIEQPQSQAPQAIYEPYDSQHNDPAIMQDQPAGSAMPGAQSIVDLVTAPRGATERISHQHPQADPEVAEVGKPGKKRSILGRKNKQEGIEPAAASAVAASYGGLQSPIAPGETTYGICPQCGQESCADWYGLCVKCLGTFPVQVGYINPVSEEPQVEEPEELAKAKKSVGSMLAKLNKPVKLKN